ncbi:MAG: hypothetical protein E6G01_06575 [Actinobacteria bacterium]|nr:MAG: hypothetical protein E6G01_06575 [Actinomycetota bacterium]
MNEKTTRATPRRYTKLIGAASAVAALVAFASPATVNAATKARTARTITTTSTSTSPELFPNSFFDHSVQNQPVAANSGTLVSNLVQQTQANNGHIGVNYRPIFTVPADQPLVPVTVASGCYPGFLSTLGNGVPIPAAAYNSNNSDNTIIISQPSTGRDWELWRATQTNGLWSACWGGGLNALTSSGVFPYPFGSSASGISYLATTITEDDVASGHINHAIPLQIKTCNGFTAPADRTDCGSNPGTPPEGTWFRMPQSTPMPAGLTPFGQMVFRSLQQYGAVVTDRAGAVMTEAENTNDWALAGHTGTDPITTASAGQPEWLVLNGTPWSQLQVIRPPSALG